ncbi:MAG: hypothetical protein ABIR77_04125 [Sphingomicrobium sp.]
MNMHSSLNGDIIREEPIFCALELLVAALEIIDNSQVPGEIGAHLDHSIQLLGSFLKANSVLGREVSFG